MNTELAHRIDRSRRAFTRVELLVVSVAIGLVLLLFLAGVFQSDSQVSVIACGGRLMHQGTAFAAFAADHGDRFPSSVGTNEAGSMEFAGDAHKAYTHFLSISPYLDNTTYLTCPLDKRKPGRSWEHVANENLSYFVAVSEGSAQSNGLLTGDRNITTNSNKLVDLVAGEVDWCPTIGLHKNRGNILFADGSVGQLSSDELQDFLRTNRGPVIRVAVP